MKNVVLLTLDATRKDALGVYGNGKSVSPTFDQWAQEALVFTNAHATGPYTRASFPGILASSHFLEYGLTKGLSSRRTLISEPLREAGIATGAFHSNPYLCEYLGWNRGWDRFYDSMDEEVDSRLAYVRGSQVNRKAFEWLKAHTSARRIDRSSSGSTTWTCTSRTCPSADSSIRSIRSLDLSEDEMYGLFQDVLLKRDTENQEIVAILRRLYDVQVREVDEYFAELLSCLEDLGVLSETGIIATSDHGDEFGEHGGLSHDDKMYSELVGVPLLIHGFEERGICDRVVSTIDVAPTIMNLFGLPSVHEFAGRSLAPSAKYIERGVHGEAVRQHGGDGGGADDDIYFYREGGLKVIHRPDAGSWELYDLASDPAERTNIIETSAEAERMREVIAPRVKRWVR